MDRGTSCTVPVDAPAHSTAPERAHLVMYGEGHNGLDLGRDQRGDRPVQDTPVATPVQDAPAEVSRAKLAEEVVQVREDLVGVGLSSSLPISAVSASLSESGQVHPPPAARTLEIAPESAAEGVIRGHG